MHSFKQRAQGILETAQMGVSDNVTLICTAGGGLHIVMDQGSFLPAARESSTPPDSAIYHVMRRGKQVFVTGRHGNQTCALDAPAIPLVPSLLLDNQALYQLAPPKGLLSAAIPVSR